MSDVSVIILVGREGLRIKRCLEKLAPLERYGSHPDGAFL